VYTGIFLNFIEANAVTLFHMRN